MFEYIENIRNAPTHPHPPFWEKAGFTHMFAITIVLLHGRHINIIMSIYTLRIYNRNFWGFPASSENTCFSELAGKAREAAIDIEDEYSKMKTRAKISLQYS